MNLLIIGLTMLWCAWAWRMWNKTALYDHRDQLFLLRDELRGFFIENGYGLDHPSYMNLRDLLNGHIRYIEEVSLTSFVANALAFSKHPEMFRETAMKTDLRFRSGDENIKNFTSYIRKSSSMVLVQYMVSTSTVLMFIVALTVPVLLAGGVIGSIKNAAAAGAESWRCALKVYAKAAVVSALACFVPMRAAYAEPTITAMEEFSCSATVMRL